jgi:filamentous hemagglutinin
LESRGFSLAETFSTQGRLTLETGVAAEERGATSVYWSVENGVTRYVGITDDLAARAAAHLRQKSIIVNEIPGLSGLARADARAVEQVLIETHGLGKNGGTLLNKINSIAKSNPAYAESLRRGVELLKQAGYPGF